MKAAVYYSNADIRIEEFSQPEIDSGEILLRVEASGICGTDVMEWYRIHRVPLVLGHEVAGTVAQVDSRVKKFKAGDRVVATHHVPCGKCEYCLDGHATVCETLRTTNFFPGGFSQFIRLPAIHVEKGTLKIPKSVSFEDATFVEPLGCAIRGQRLAGMKKGCRVLVTGSGISGLLHIKLAKFWGAEKIVATDVDEFRLNMAREFGADQAVYANEDAPGKIRQVFDGKLANIVILCSGAQTAIAQGLKSVERGGSVLFFAAAGKDAPFPVSVNDIFWRSEVRLLSSYAADPDDLKEALKLISTQKIKVRDMITHRLPLEETQRGFDLVLKPHNSIKVIIEPNR